MRAICLLFCLLIMRVEGGAQIGGSPFDGVRYGIGLTSRKAFFLSYANDLFAGTDRYFTQGIALGFRHPPLRTFDLLRLFTPIPDSNAIYTLVVNHEGFTPSTIRADSILYGDRPYAATLTLECIRTANGPDARTSISRALTVGLIGPAAKGREMQTAIHRATGDFIPLGWQYQIRNDLLLNYALRFRRAFLHRAPFRFYAEAQGDVGTQKCALSTGFTLNVVPIVHSKAIQPSMRATVEGRAIGYDARLQGGVLNRSSPYILRASEISRMVGSAQVQIRADYRRMAIGGEYAWLTREFKTGMSHEWGRLFVEYGL